MKRALVLGATGHIGCAISSALVEEGWAVTAASRRGTLPASLRDRPRVQLLAGSADQQSWLARAVVEHDAVFDAAAPYPLSLGDARGAAAEATRRTHRLLAAISPRKVPLVYISTFATLPPGAGGPRNSSEGLHSRHHPYFIVKRCIERELCESGQDVVILNPPACLGPWDPKPTAQCLIPLTANRMLPWRTNHVVNVLDVRDLGLLAVAALDHAPRLEPTPVAGRDVNTGALADAIAELAGVPAPRVPASAVLGAAVSWWSENWLWGFGLRTPAPSLPLLLLAASGPMAPSRFQQTVRFRPTPLEKTLRDALLWYRQRGCC